MSYWFLISVTGHASNDQDVDVPGFYLVSAVGHEGALDIFHNDIPIAVLDDFDIILTIPRIL